MTPVNSQLIARQIAKGGEQSWNKKIRYRSLVQRYFHREQLDASVENEQRKQENSIGLCTLEYFIETLCTEFNENCSLDEISEHSNECCSIGYTNRKGHLLVSLPYYYLYRIFHDIPPPPGMSPLVNAVSCCHSPSSAPQALSEFFIRHSIFTM